MLNIKLTLHVVNIETFGDPEKSAKNYKVLIFQRKDPTKSNNYKKGQHLKNQNDSWQLCDSLANYVYLRVQGAVSNLNDGDAQYHLNCYTAFM